MRHFSFSKNFEILYHSFIWNASYLIFQCPHKTNCWSLFLQLRYPYLNKNWLNDSIVFTSHTVMGIVANSLSCYSCVDNKLTFVKLSSTFWIGCNTISISIFTFLLTSPLSSLHDMYLDVLSDYLWVKCFLITYNLKVESNFTMTTNTETMF